MTPAHGSGRPQLPPVEDVLEHMTDAAALLDRELRCRYLNGRAVTMIGLPAEELLGRSIVDVFPGFERAPFFDAYRRAVDRGETGVVEAFFEPLGRWLHQRIHPFAGGVLVFVQDVTERRAAELEVARSEQRHRVLAHALGDAVFRTDADGRILQQADWGRLTGGPPPARWDEIVHPDDLERVMAAWRLSLRTGRELDVPYRVRSASDGWRHVRARAVPVTDEGGVREWVGVMLDVTEEVTANEALQRAAREDALTGLANREVFLADLRRALSRRAPRVAVVYVDVDRFKAINDRFGHACGDLVLRTVGTRLREVVRPSDVVSRLSGDEFAVMCEDLDADEAAVAIAGRILEAVARPVPGDERIRVSASVGVAFGDRGGGEQAASAVLRSADAAMYVAKQAGGNTVEVFDDTLRTRLRHRARIERELRAGLDQDGLQLHFQPIVPLAGSGGPPLAEALLRWQARDGEPLPAAEAISVAEQTGLIHRIGREVLREACRHAAAWQREAGDVGVAVNVSARQFARHEDLLADVRGALGDSGLAPALLTLEITETVLMEDMDHGEGTLRALRDLGVGLAIDDFGVGYSSLSYLRRLPVGAVKLDRTFVAGLPGDTASARIVEAVVGLSRAFGITVTAEGVETPGQLRALTAAGCHAAQGFHLARPGPADGLADGLRQAAAAVGS